MVREFLYVDVERARSMLAQPENGVVDTVVQKSKTANKLSGTLKVPILGGVGERSSELSRDESRSLQDLTYAEFEASAETHGLLHEAPDELQSPAAWESGAVHADLHGGQIVRLACDLQVLDPTLFATRIDRFSTLMRSVAEMTVESDAQPVPDARYTSVGRDGKKRTGSSSTAKEADRAERIDIKTRSMFDGTDPRLLPALARATLSFVGDLIVVRALPCGSGHPEFSFGGVLLPRNEYIQQEREALFSRHGSLLRGWTILMQIATVPPKSDEPGTLPSLSGINIMTMHRQISRTSFERMVTQFVGVLESIGVSEGPRWPSVTMTPLAIYRPVPTAAVRRTR